MKIAAGIEYSGVSFAGWQRQNHAPSVQQHVEKALSMVADESIRIYCAGRTDAGVHAVQQVIHFETTVHREAHSWVFGSNVNLPEAISLVWAKPVTDKFHARFSAITRTYRYIILNRSARPGITRGFVTWEYRPLNMENMMQGAIDLIGEHDFTSFRAKDCQAKSPVRHIHRLDIHRYEDYVITEIEANAFLHHMVRNIMGVLMAVGTGKKKPSWIKYVLEARDREAGGVTAPPQGLYLIGVTYPEEFNIPEVTTTEELLFTRIKN